MKKNIARLAILIIAAAIIAFFYPKDVSTGVGFDYPGKVYHEYKCAGIGIHIDISDGTILKCFGIPYLSAIKTSPGGLKGEMVR